jgi:hypothetical protein
VLLNFARSTAKKNLINYVLPMESDYEVTG